MSCPDLETCSIPITLGFFRRFCHGEENFHEACHYYCERHGLLKPPMQWLQDLAIAAELKPPARWVYEGGFRKTV